MRGGAPIPSMKVKMGGDAYGYNKRSNADDFVRH